MKEEQPYYPTAETGQHLDENAIGQYAEFLCGLAQEIPDAIRIHAETCESCRMEVMAAADLIGQQENIELPKPAVRWKPLLRTAAALASIFILALIIQRLSTNPSEPLSTPTTTTTTTTTNTTTTTTTPTTPTLPTTTTTTKTSSSFTPNPTYENLISSSWRAEVTPEVKGPAGDRVYSRKDTLRITWDAAFKDEFSLIIVDNQGNEIRVVDAVVAGQIECLTDLPEGLYYWKLVGRKEMWGVGRIKVRNSEE